MRGVAGSNDVYAQARMPRRRFRWPFRLTRWIVGLGLLIGLFFTLFVPTMCRSTEAANRIKCQSNLRQLGLAMRMYADSHDCILPTDWQALAQSADLTADVFICPTSDDDRMHDASDVTVWSSTLDDPAAHHCSYYYTGRGLNWTALKPDDILAFEAANDHKGDGINILFGDGHTEWQNIRQADKPAFDRLEADAATGVRPLRWRVDHE